MSVGKAADETFTTYVINLRQERNKFRDLSDALAARGFREPRLFDAVYGRTVPDFSAYSHILTRGFQCFGPYGALGSGISHYQALERGYRECTSKYVLVLEDDAVPMCDAGKFADLVRRAPSDTDILLVHTREEPLPGIYLAPTGVPPACAYLVRRGAIPRILAHKLWMYFDLLTFRFNVPGLKIYRTGTDLFSTSYDHSHNLGSLVPAPAFLRTGSGGRSWHFRLLRLPGVGIELSSWDVAVVAALLACAGGATSVLGLATLSVVVGAMHHLVGLFPAPHRLYEDGRDHDHT